MASLIERLVRWLQGAPSDPRRPVVSMDGLLEYSGGRLQLTPPRGSGRWPVLIPGDGVEVRVDGQVVKGPVVVTRGMRVEVRVRDHDPVRRFRVSLGEGCMTAVLELEGRRSPRPQLKDAGPSRILHLQAVPVPTELADPDVATILAALRDLQVTHGVDVEAILAALASPEPVRAVVARGAEPLHGQDGRVEVHGPWGEDPDPAKEVPQGAVLATCHDPTPGMPGHDVRGNPLQPAPGRPVSLVAGEGVQVGAGGRQAVAARAGAPLVRRGEEQVFLAVVPVHRSRVAGREVAAPESLCVAGPVTGGAVVRARGSLWLCAGLEGAVAVARGSVTVRGPCHEGWVAAGGGGAVAPHLHQVVEAVQPLLQQVYEVADMALRHPRYSRLTAVATVGPLVQILITHKFPQLAQLITAMRRLALLAPWDVPAGLVDLASQLDQGLVQGGVRRLEEVDRLLVELRTAGQALAEVPARRSADGVHLHGAVASHIYSAGDVTVGAEGCTGCHVVALGQVTIQGRLCGGEVLAGGDVRLGEVRGLAGEPARVVASPGATVVAARVAAGTVVRIGGQEHVFASEAGPVAVRLGPGGRLTVEAGGEA